MNDVPFVVEIDSSVRPPRSFLVDIEKISVQAIEIRRPFASGTGGTPLQNMIFQVRPEGIGAGTRRAGGTARGPGFPGTNQKLEWFPWGGSILRKQAAGKNEMAAMRRFIVIRVFL